MATVPHSTLGAGSRNINAVPSSAEARAEMVFPLFSSRGMLSTQKGFGHHTRTLHAGGQVGVAADSEFVVQYHHCAYPLTEIDRHTQ